MSNDGGRTEGYAVAHRGELLAVVGQMLLTSSEKPFGTVPREDAGVRWEETHLRGGAVMQWDLGFEGLALLGVISCGFGMVAALAVGKSAAHRLLATAVTTLACLGTGLLTSEVFFGWATEEDLQPNVDGLSRDEVLLSSVLTTAVVVLVMRHLARRPADPMARRHAHRSVGRHAAPHQR